ncbi:MAG: hypothetical protein M3139_16545 [Bacteroidota bacterium]|nr:hypothetical protein [Bacteroidota bacterium]
MKLNNFLPGPDAFQLLPVDGDTNRGGPPWAVSPPPIGSKALRQFENAPSGLQKYSCV